MGWHAEPHSTLVRHRRSILTTSLPVYDGGAVRPPPGAATCLQTDAIKAPLWDVAALGPAAYPSNAAFAQQYTANLLTTSFPNLRPQQVQVGSAGWLPFQGGWVGRCGLQGQLVYVVGGEPRKLAPNLCCSSEAWVNEWPHVVCALPGKLKRPARADF